MRRNSTYVGGAVFLGAILASGGARAQLLERFDPAERGSRFFVADSLELDGNVRLATGLVTSFGSSLRTFRQTKGDPEASTLVSSALYFHPGASVVLAPGARFSLDVPIAIQSGEDVTLDGTFHPKPETATLGDVRLAVDFRLFGRTRSDVDGFALAAGVVGYLPTGTAASFSGDDFVRIGVRVASTFTKGAFVGAARVHYMYRKDDVPPLAGVEIGSELGWVLAAGAQWKGFVLGPELYGSTRLNDPFQRRSTPAELLFGVHIPLGELRAGAGFGGNVVTGLGAASFRGVFSIEWTPPPSADVAGHDRDHDGVVDDDDICPDVPGVAEAPPEIRGCPIGPGSEPPLLVPTTPPKKEEPLPLEPERSQESQPSTAPPDPQVSPQGSTPDR